MTREQAAKFVTLFNRAAYHLPQSHLEPIAESEVMKMIVAVANGHALCELKPPPMPEAPAAKPADPSLEPAA